jgi:hypothetical protein
MQVGSMLKNREETAIICDDEFKKVRSKSSPRNSKVFINSDILDRMCKSPSRVYIHSHANFVKDFSTVDWDVADDLLSLKGIDYFCSAGIDGVFCIDGDKKEIEIPWTERFDETVIEEGDNFVAFGDVLFCDKSDKKGEKGKFKCSMSWRDISYRMTDAFDQIVAGNGTSVLNDYNGFFSSYVKGLDEVIKCTSSKSKGEDILICNKMKINDLDRVDNDCGVLDICGMEADDNQAKKREEL